MLAVTLGPAAVSAEAADPAAAQIEAFDAALIGAMKLGKAAGMDGRYKALAPAVERTLDLPVMTRFAVGPKWTTFSAGDQAALVRAFGRLSIATYAKNFDSFGGETFVIDPKVDARGPDKLVRSHLISPGSKPVDLAYRMRQAVDGRWKVIDVYYNGSISELATRRSDFAAAIGAGGAPALLKKIDALSDRLMRGA